ncbi:DEAD/DEAH box helicase family protein [Algibacter lectus]|uniref:Helicase-like protein n=1 Tax=Algibacter lectus TaxID=221126 RepID=A0A4R8M632_9FLAO|nr:DEAD/DEAH box helicase family protein [Algibacter lectus]MWW26235.1 DEAD/DEAH box helicase [Algibacter lectus]TDY60288.1 helicase-like protein [Algibacter lectus]
MLESFRFLEFNFPWRSYQANLLKHFNTHIEDNHFHVIAPPGSGKTILGIEIIRKLNKKTLVLAPTLTIRNQWENRLQTFFTRDEDFEPFSFDLKAPKDITFSTYQSLHAFYKTFEDKNDYYAFFKKHNIQTLVLDEAHHLKNAWWTCLIDLKENIPFHLVALTATPPYDSDRTEVAKYFKLCGDIDDEIAVPDLVRETDLCPHQDFVYFSKPEDLEINFIVEYRKKIATFNDELIEDEAFISFLKAHRFYKSPKYHLEAIYSNTEYFSAILIFLNACGISIEKEKLELLGFEGDETIQFPELQLEWLGVLFQNLLVSDRELLIDHEVYLMRLEKKLRQLDVFRKRKVDFIGENLLYKSLSNSPSKLKSIVDIVKAERENLKEDLRCVILTDYIRKEFLNSQKELINSIGVMPIFQFIRSSCSHKEDLAVLSGSLVIVHKSVLEPFNKIESCDSFSFSPLEIDADFLVVSSKIKTKNSIVSIITKLFEDGDIKVLVGTKSLLGEGWDAPSINSLILASFIGSFVSSNQMRGRAIRKDADKPDKTGNIWHLACVDITDASGGRDVEVLKRRFDAFVGVTNNDVPFISNGIDRLNFPEHFLEEDIDVLNEVTLKRAKDRGETTKKWEDSIGKGTRLTKDVRLFYIGDKPFTRQRQLYYFDAIRFFVVELMLAISVFYVEFILRGINLVVQRGVLYFIYAFLAAFLFSFGLKLYRAITLYVKHGYLYKKIQNMGLSILDTMVELNYITTNKEALIVTSSLVNKGDVSCSLLGGNAYESAVFSKALSEIINPINSPRYLIIKSSFFRKRLDIENFYPVPEIFGDKKAKALVFQKHWNTHIGKSKLFYTRHKEGRRLLLKARLAHVHNAFKKVSKEVMVWK